MLKEDEIYYMKLEDAEKYNLFGEEITKDLYGFTKYPFFKLKAIKKEKDILTYVWQLMPFKDIYVDFCEHDVKNTKEKIEFYENLWNKVDRDIIEMLDLDKMLGKK